MMAVLVRNGEVVARQGWFDAADLENLIAPILKAANPVAGSAKAARAEWAAVEDRFKQAGITIYDIRELVEAGNVDALGKLLETLPELAKSAMPYGVLGRGETNGLCMLPAAAKRGQFEVVDLLLKHGVDINVQSAGVPSALRTAATTGEIDHVAKLLDRKADVNRPRNAAPRRSTTR